MILGYPTILIPGLQGKSNDNSTTHPDFELSDQQISWIGSVNMLFVPIGCLISGLFMEAMGKRRMMQVDINKTIPFLLHVIFRKFNYVKLVLPSK